jgi:site-specific DNA-methyltransferase (adenine-specific)
MAQLPAGSVQLAFADPPFNIGYEYDVYDDRRAYSEYLQWSRDWLTQVHRVLTEDGTFWLAIGDEYAAELKLAAQEVGFHCRSWVIWYYTFGVNCSRKFSRSHAHLFYLVKDRNRFTFREDELENRIPSARQLVYHDRRANARGRLPDDTWMIRPADAAAEIQESASSWSPGDFVPGPDEQQTWTLRPQDLAEQFSAEEDTWYFPRVAGTFKERAGFHGCQMPEQLLGRIIRLCSNPGDLVLDPFAGSATTLVVAKKLGRRWLGFELSPEYAAHGQARLDQVRVGDPLAGSAEPTMSAPETFQQQSRPRQSRASAKSAVPTAQRATEERFAQTQLLLTEQGVQAAFELTCQGYSVDRVVADPELNGEFHRACTRFGLLGDPRFWNTLLFRLRKRGALQHIPTHRRTELAWHACEPFLFASEIAWQSLLSEGQAGSLDEILCDPQLVAEFDRRASNYAPGFRVFEYRWGALKLRKQVKTARVQGAVLSPPPRGLKPVAWSEVQSATLTGGGVYLVTAAAGEHLYVGETSDLAQRFSIQFGPGQTGCWQSAGELQIKVFQTNPQPPLAWQACFARKFRPRLNLEELIDT